MKWHLTRENYDWSQDPDLGATLVFVCDLGAARTEAATAGYDIGDSVTIKAKSCTVRDLKVAGVNGVDEVTVFASTTGYVFHWTPDEDDHEANDEEWRLRFASKLVPGDQIVAPDGATLAAAAPPPAPVLLPQPIVMLEWRKWLDKALPDTKAKAIDVAKTYSGGLGAPTTAFETGAPKAGYTLKGEAKFLCTGIELEKDGALVVRTAEYELNPEGWLPAAAFPEGAEA